jgi:hypothetical protein
MRIFLTAILVAGAALSMAQAPCCKDKKPSQEETFLKMAREMEMTAEGKKACCQTTATKSVEKGDKGCCNAKGEPAKFKVFVTGAGYKFFGCEDSAAQGRKELLAKGSKVGKVEKVSRKASL